MVVVPQPQKGALRPPDLGPHWRRRARGVGSPVHSRGPCSFKRAPFTQEVREAAHAGIREACGRGCGGHPGPCGCRPGRLSGPDAADLRLRGLEPFGRSLRCGPGGRPGRPGASSGSKPRRRRSATDGPCRLPRSASGPAGPRGRRHRPPEPGLPGLDPGPPDRQPRLRRGAHALQFRWGLRPDPVLHRRRNPHADDGGRPRLDRPAEGGARLLRRPDRQRPEGGGLRLHPAPHDRGTGPGPGPGGRGDAAGFGSPALAPLTPASGYAG